MFKDKSELLKLLGVFVFGNFLLFLDIEFSSEIHFSYLLVLIVLLTTWSKGKNITITSGYFASVLCIVGIYPDIVQRPVPFNAILNHLLSIAGIWIAVWFVLRSKVSDKLKIKEQEKLDALFENATEGFLITDTSGKIVLSNPAATKQFGYTREELVGKTVEQLMPARFQSGHSRYRNAYYVNPHSRSMGIGMNLAGLRKDGSEFPIEISLSSFVSDEGMYVIAFIIDITERKKDEQEIARHVEEIQNLNSHLEQTVEERTSELAKAIAALEESQEEMKNSLEKERQLNELKSRFVNMASHEFRTPLSSILSSVTLIEKYTTEEQQEKRVKHIDRIKSGVKNMNEILNDFLSVGKLEEGNIQSSPEHFNLTELLNDTLETMSTVLKPGQHFEKHFTEKEIVAFTDPKILRNILINLISNASKYSNENAKIELSVADTPSEILIAVTDFGIGIPEEEQQHLFGRFFRAGNATNIQGTGLGLNIVKRYAELIDADITFKSTYEVGSTFYIHLPKK